jgi:hypothetical protein
VTKWVTDLVSTAQANERFVVLDAVSDALPLADAVLCRDLIVHLPFRQGMKVVENFRRSGAKFLIATTFPGRRNVDIHPGGWRPLDLSAAPFGLGEPLRLIVEGCTEGGGAYRDKSLGVWRLR